VRKLEVRSWERGSETSAKNQSLPRRISGVKM